MACRRCDACDINYPQSEGISRCRVCDGITLYQGNEPEDDDWKSMVERKTGGHHLPAVDRDHIVEHNGQAWIANSWLLDAGYMNVAVEDIIRVEGYTTTMYFEIDGPAKSNEPTKIRKVAGWWIHRIRHEGVFDDATPEQVIRGAD